MSLPETNLIFLSIWPYQCKEMSEKLQKQIQYFSFKKSVICKLATILLRPQWVEGCQKIHPSVGKGSTSHLFHFSAFSIIVPLQSHCLESEGDVFSTMNCLWKETWLLDCIFTCNRLTIVSWIVQLNFHQWAFSFGWKRNSYRGYPAKRALSAMRKHGG